MTEEVSKVDMKRVNIRVSPEVHEWFKDRSDRTGVSMSALMFLALERYIHEQKAIQMMDMVKRMEGGNAGLALKQFGSQVHL